MQKRTLWLLALITSLSFAGLSSVGLLAGCNSGGDDDPASGSEEATEESNKEAKAEGVEPAEPGEGWSCTVLSLTAPDENGLQVKAPGDDKNKPVRAGTALEPGSVVTTTANARAVLKMNDGGLVFLDNATTVELVAGEARSARVEAGQAVFDLPPMDDAPHAHIYTPSGEVVLLGTKVAVAVSGSESRVTVTRGKVKANGVEAGPGDEILLRDKTEPSVGASPDLGAAAGWAELNDEPVSVPRGLGSLTAKQPGRSNDAPLKKVKQEVDVKIRGLMAYTEVTEVFANETGQTLEGVYRFPLPDDAQISRLALLVDGRLQEGAFVENRRAERIWKSVIREWRDPAWLRWQHGNQFELRIFPIEPHSQRKVIIGYTQRLDPTSDGRAYVYPMPVDTDGRIPVEDFAFIADVTGHDPQRPIAVSGYRANVKNGDKASIQFSAENFKAAGDMTIRFPLDGEAQVRTAGFRDPKRPGEDGFVVMSLRPELPRAAQVKSRDVVIVADRSYSRTGVARDLQSKLIGRVIAEMDPADRVTVIACNERCVPVGKPGFDPPGVGTANLVHSALEELPAEGATNVLEPIRVVGALAREREDKRPLRIIYFTDGVASTGALDPGQIQQGTQQALSGLDVRVTVADLGGSRDRLAMDALAQAGNGSVVELEPNGTLTTHALNILGQQYGPVLTDATLELPAGMSAVFPQKIPALPAGDELVVLARASSGNQGNVVIRGNVSGKPFEETIPVSYNLSTSLGNAYVARLWAEQQIRALELANAELNRKEIVNLSQRFGLVSRHTSLLTLESSEMRREFGVRKDRTTRWDPDAEGEEIVAGVEEVVEQDEAAATDTAVLESEDADNSMHGALSGDSFGTASGSEPPRGMDPAPSSGLGDIGSSGGMADGSTGLSGLGGSGKSAGGGSSAGPGTRELGRGSGGSTADGFAAGEGAAPEAEPMEESMPDMDSEKSERKERSRSRDKASPPMKDGKSKAKKADAGDDIFGEVAQPAKKRPTRGKGWKRRRRVERVSIRKADAPGADRLVEKRRKAVEKEPESITRRKALVRSLSLAERFDEAQKEAQAWVDMNPMDAEALVVSAEIQARLGKTDKAERLLANAVDAQPRAEWLRERLAAAYQAIGDDALACNHKAALKSVANTETGNALNCPIASDWSLFLKADPSLQGLAPPGWAGDGSRSPVKADELRNPDMEVTVSWNAQGADLDVGVIPPNGRYTTWLGGEDSAFFNVNGPGPERMQFRRLRDGTHRVDVVRRDNGKDPVSATVTVKAKGKTEAFNVTLGPLERKTVAEVSKRMVWR